MPIPKGTAIYIDVILRWMTGDADTTTAHAYSAAAVLAERNRAVLGAGVAPIALRQCERLADRPHATHRMLAELLADCWAAAEGDGSWSGSAVVDVVTRALTAHGYDTTYPRLGDDRPEPDLLRGIALTRARDATANAVTHAEPASAARVSPECATDQAGRS